jgi:putative sigma-54 modulation protein
MSYITVHTMNTLTIQTHGVELTDALKDYAEKRFSGIGKYLKDGEEGIESLHLILAKTTNHHKQGEIYRAEVTVSVKGVQFFSYAETDHLYAAIDEVREEVARKITGERDRTRALFRRGARSIKKMLKGISKRNPFTSKVDAE